MKNSIFNMIDPPILLDANALNTPNAARNLEFAYKDIKEECSRELSLIKALDGKFNVLLAFITALLTVFATIINILYNQHDTTKRLTIAIIVFYMIVVAIYIIFGLSKNKLLRFSENNINKYINKNHDEMLIDYINEYISLLNSAKKLYRIKSLVFLLCIVFLFSTFIVSAFISLIFL